MFLSCLRTLPLFYHLPLDRVTLALIICVFYGLGSLAVIIYVFMFTYLCIQTSNYTTFETDVTVKRNGQIAW